MNAIYRTSETRDSNGAHRSDFKALASRLDDFNRALQLKLAGTSAGRIVLHLVLAVATCHFAWHFQGIARELAGTNFHLHS